MFPQFVIPPSAPPPQSGGQGVGRVLGAEESHS
jgi:hypothetical protein